MSPQDQVPAAAPEQSEKPLTMDEQFDRGWEQVELITEQERKATAKPATPAPSAPPKDEGDSTSKPYRVLKVGGKEISVGSEEELIALAQKGADYTKKTQALADERRDAEAKLKTETDTLASQAARMNELLDKLVAAGIVPEKIGAAHKQEPGAATPSEDKAADEDAAIYQEFQMDPLNAYPHEKKIVQTIASMRKELDSFKIARATDIVDAAIAEERENFPYDDIVDDHGQEVTKRQLSTIILGKKQMSGIDRPDIGQIEKWAREAVRELHQSQSLKSSASITDDMDPADFAKKFPSLASKIKGLGAEDAQATRESVPPSIRPAQRPTDLRAKPKTVTGGKSLDDFLNEGFSDPDIIKAFTRGG